MREHSQRRHSRPYPLRFVVTSELETSMSVYLIGLRWIARLSGLFVAGAFVVLVVGEFFAPHSAPPSTLREWTGILLLTATCAGMVVACRWELAGAAISLASLVAFIVMVHFNQYTVHCVLAIPGLLFLADWLLQRPHRSISPASPVARITSAG